MSCPNCGHEEYVCIEVSDSSGSCALVVGCTGSVRPRVCLNCGVVYLSKERLEEIKDCENRLKRAK